MIINTSLYQLLPLIFAKCFNVLVLASYPRLLNRMFEQLGSSQSEAYWFRIFFALVLFLRIYFTYFETCQLRRKQVQAKLFIATRLARKALLGDKIPISAQLNKGSQNLILGLVSLIQNILSFLISLFNLASIIGSFVLYALAVLFVLALALFKITSLVTKLSNQITEYTAEKNKLVVFFLNRLRDFKINSFTEWFVNKAAVIRSEELRTLTSIKYLDAFCVFFWAIIPNLVIVIVLLPLELAQRASYSLEIIFYVRHLIQPVNSLPWIISGCSSNNRNYQVIETLIARPLPQRPRLLSGSCFLKYSGRVQGAQVDFTLQEGRVYQVKGARRNILCKSLCGLLSFQGTLESRLKNPKVLYEQKATYIPEQLQDFVKEEHKKQFQELLGEFECGYLLSRKNLRLCSGGEKARLAIARAMVHRPDLLILDQALSSLNNKLRIKVVGKVKQFAAQTRAAVLVVGCQFESKLIVEDEGVRQQFQSEENDFPNVEQESEQLQLRQQKTAAKEVKAKQQLTWSNFKKALRLAGPIQVLVVTLSALACCMLNHGFNLILKTKTQVTNQFLLSLVAGQFLLTSIRSGLFARSMLKICRTIHQRLYSLMPRLSLASGQQEGQVLTACINGTRSADSEFPFVLNILLNNVMTLISLLFFSFYLLTFQLAIFLILTLLIILFIYENTAAKTNSLRQSQNSYQAEFQEISIQLSQNSFTFKQYQLADQKMAVFLARLEKLNSTDLEQNFTFAAYRSINYLVLHVYRLLFFYIVSRGYFSDTSEAKIIMYNINPLIMFISFAIQTYAKTKSELQTVGLALDLANSLESRQQHDLAKSCKQHSIVLKIDSFGHQGQPPLFQNTGLLVRRGEKVAIVGKSGLGKTTLLNLVVGLYSSVQPIVLDSFGYISQHPLLVPAGPEENINASAIKSWKLEDSCQKSPEQVFNICKERAHLQSKGRLLILDEPLELPQQPTESLLLATHNYALIDQSFRILTIEGRRIVEIEHAKLKQL